MANCNITAQAAYLDIRIEGHAQIDIAITICDHQSIALLVQLPPMSVSLDSDGLLIPATYIEIAVYLCYDHFWLCGSRKCLLHSIVLRFFWPINRPLRLLKEN